MPITWSNHPQKFNKTCIFSFVFKQKHSCQKPYKIWSSNENPSNSKHSHFFENMVSNTRSWGANVDGFARVCNWLIVWIQKSVANKYTYVSIEIPVRRRWTLCCCFASSGLGNSATAVAVLLLFGRTACRRSGPVRLFGYDSETTALQTRRRRSIVSCDDRKDVLIIVCKWMYGSSVFVKRYFYLVVPNEIGQVSFPADPNSLS